MLVGEIPRFQYNFSMSATFYIVANSEKMGERCGHKSPYFGYT